MPNGSYTIKLYGEPGFGGFNFNDDTCGNSAGQNLFDWRSRVMMYWVGRTGYVRAGNQPYHGWTLINPATVTDNALNVFGRNRNVNSIYGVAWSSLLIAPCNQTVSITTSSLPSGMVGIAYNQSLQATCGTSPYTGSIASGSLPAGLSRMPARAPSRVHPRLQALRTSPFGLRMPAQIPRQPRSASPSRRLTLPLHSHRPHRL